MTITEIESALFAAEHSSATPQWLSCGLIRNGPAPESLFELAGVSDPDQSVPR